jgi:beta-galactosidase
LFGNKLGERPLYYSFCCDSIVRTDRQPTPKVEEIKALYQPVVLMPGRARPAHLQR